MRVAFVGRKQVLDFLPLRVRQIARVAFVLRTITFTLLFGPHEVTPCWRMENMGAPQSTRLSVIIMPMIEQLDQPSRTDRPPGPARQDRPDRAVVAPPPPPPQR